MSKSESLYFRLIGNMRKMTFIAWQGYHRRSEILAQHLGATLHFIYYRPSFRLFRTPIRYVVQAWQTWHVLRLDRPDVVFVQNPPIFCVMVAFLYARRYGAQYVIDSHTGAFLSSKWRWSVGLHRILSKRALATIVHNNSQEEIVKEWGCRYLVIGFTPGSYPPGEHFALDGQFNVAVVSSFGQDESPGLVFEAAALLPEVSFYVTGNPARIARPVLFRKPGNCCLTGYLSYERYVGLLRGVDAIMVLTTSDHTLLMGAFEAVSVGTPLIVSDWPILRGYFSSGTVYVPNTAEGICEGVRLAQRNRTALRQGILVLQEQLQAEWERRFAELQQFLNEQ
jgi:glycosyltransferase involved in cell wall biosynthesis